MGLNVAMPGAAAAIDRHGPTSKPWGRVPTPVATRCLRALLNELLPLLAGFEQQQGFAPWREQWLELDAFADEPVVLYTGAGDTAASPGAWTIAARATAGNDRGVQSIYGGRYP